MEKKEFCKNENKITNQINQLERLSNLLTNNLNKLEVFNGISHLIDKDFIFELTTIKNNQNSKNEIINYIKKESKFDNTSNIQSKINYLIDVLFYPGNLEEMTEYKNIPSLIQYNGCIIELKYLLKDSFEFDYNRNEVKLKEEVKQKIIEENTTYLINENQLKVLELIKDIDKKFNELKKYHDVKNSCTPNIFKNFGLLYNNTIDIYNDRELNLLTVYNFFLSNLK